MQDIIKLIELLQVVSIGTLKTLPTTTRNKLKHWLIKIVVLINLIEIDEKEQ